MGSTSGCRGSVSRHHTSEHTSRPNPGPLIIYEYQYSVLGVRLLPTYPGRSCLTKIPSHISRQRPSHPVTTHLRYQRIRVNISIIFYQIYPHLTYESQPPRRIWGSFGTLSGAKRHSRVSRDCCCRKPEYHSIFCLKYCQDRIVSEDCLKSYRRASHKKGFELWIYRQSR